MFSYSCERGNILSIKSSSLILDSEIVEYGFIVIDTAFHLHLFLLTKGSKQRCYIFFHTFCFFHFTMSFRLYVCHAIPFPVDGDVEILCKNNKKYQEKQKIGVLFYHPADH